MAPSLGATRLASGAMRLALRPPADAVAAAGRLERRARASAGELAGRTGLGIVDAIVASPYTERAVDHVLESPGMERLVTRIVESPGMERTVGQVLDSRLLDQVVERLLETEELWILVDEIARSPAVTDAITQQSLGFADEVADEVNVRTRRADAVAERIARRLLRRRARAEPPPPAAAAAPAPAPAVGP